MQIIIKKGEFIMKLRRILAGVLAFAMVITASPLENVRFEAAGTTKTVSAIDETYMRWSETVKANSGGYLERQNTDGIRNDMPYIDSLRSNIKSLNSDMIEQFDASGEEWHWFAYRVNVQTEGTYTLGVAVNGCKYASYAIPLCVNNEVYTLTYTSKNQQVTTDVTLPIGEHVIVMFAPMPTDASDLVGTSMNIWNDYPWCNVQSVIVDSDLEVIKNSDKQLTDEEVVASFYSKVESGNTAYVTYDHMAEGGYKQDGTGAGGVSRSKVAQTLSQLITGDGKLNYLAKESLPYVQYIVDVEADGTYYLDIEYYMKAVAVEGDDKTAFAVIVNDKLYKVAHTETASTAKDFSQTIEVELKKGRNVIRTTGIIKDTVWFDGSWMNYKSLAIEAGAKFVPVSQTSVNAGDEATILANKYSDKGTTLGDRDYSILRYDYATIDTLKYAGNKIGDWPFASVQVTAEKDGYYDITVNAGPNTGGQSFQIGMLVDGEAYSLPFMASASTSIDASVYLTVGTHVLTFTSPMPETIKDVTWSQSYAYLYYPWFNFTSFTLGTGLEIAEKPELSDITAHLGTTMEASDSTLLVNKFGVTERDDTDNPIHKKYSSPDRSILTAKNITLENVLDLGYDKLPYIAYEVNVESAGTYEVGAIVKTKSGTSSQMGLIIDGTQVKGIPLAATAKEEFVSASVELSAGTHTIMLTCAMPKDSSTTEYPWFDIFELCISNGATIGNIHAQDTNVTVEMENTTYVSGGTQKPYAGASSGKVVGTEINSSEKLADVWKSDDNKLLQIDWGQMSYAEFATTGTAGEHEIQLKVIATCTPDKKVADKEPEVYVYVNGEVYKKQLDAWNTFETITIKADLVEGINEFKCFAVADDASGDTSIFFDTFYFDTTKLTAVSLEEVADTKTEISFADTTQVFTHKYPVSEDGTKLANPVAGDMQYRKYYIDALTINQLTYVPYAAVKVAAENAGYYEIEIEANVKTEAAAADRIAMLVDGKAYTLRYKKSGADTLSTMIYLEKGTHMLIFTSPMPQTYDEVKNVVYPTGEGADFTELKNLYPWFDMKTLTLDEGLSIVEKPGYGDVDFSEVIDSVDTIIDAGDETLVLPDNYNDNDAILDGAARDELKNDRVSLETLLLHGFDKAPYASFKVTAPADGTYDIYALVATDANLTSDQIAFIVDRMQVYAVAVEKKADNQIIHATVELTKGTHSIIFTAPMPLNDEEAQAIPAGETDNWAGLNGKYRWMNYIRFGIDKDLTLVSGNTDSITNGIEAEDSEYVKYHGNYEVQIYPGATGNHAVNGKDTAMVPGVIDKEALFHDWSKLSFIEFAVDAQSTGTQNITLGVIATNADNYTAGMVPVLMVYANGKWQEVSLEKWNTFEEVTVSIDLIEGKNIIRCVAEWRDVAGGTRVIFDYIEYDTSALTAVKAEDFATGSTTYNAGDEEKVLSNKYTDNGDTLGSASCADMRWSKYYIEGLKVTQLPRIPYAALKVNATVAGYYDIGMTAEGDSSALSKQIAILVDGKAYPLTVGATLSASVYLEAGVHTLMFTSPMPVDKATADTTSSTNETKLYPWFNMNTITLGEGLEVTEKITTEEVMLAEVLRSVHGLTTAGDDTIVLPNRYTDNNGVLESADRNALKNNRVSVETLLEKGFDKAPFASFNVTAEENGTYDIYALVSANSALTSKQIVVIVDRTRIVSVPVEAVEGTQMIHASLGLEAGTHNIIFTTPMPQTDAEAQALLNDGSDNWSGMNNAYPWMNYEYFAIDKDLTVKTGIKDSTTTGIEAEDSTYIKHTGAYEVQIYPGASSAQAVVGQNISTDAVDTDAIYYDWNKFAGVEFAVKAQSEGSQVITLGMIATHAAESTTATAPKLMVYANGVWKEATLTKWNTFEEVAITVNLKEGTNVIKCVPVAAEEVAGTRVIFDYIEYDTSALTAVKAEDFATGSTTYNAGDEEKVLSNKYTDNGDTLGSASCADMRWSKYYIEGLKVTQLPRIPYAALKVNATVAGYYDIGMTAEGDSSALSKQIAILVDGKAYPLTVGATLSASVYLEAGVHTLMFTSPMPVDKATADTTSSTNETKLYPWFNMNTITLGEGLEVTEKITTEEVMLAEVLRSVHGLTTAGDDTIVLPNRYTDNNGVLESADRNALKNNRVSVETLLEKGFDKAPFASFNVTAEENGTYDIYALVSANSALTSKQIVVIVDRTRIVSVPVEAVEGTQMIHASLGLEAGTHNIIFTTPMPQTDAEAQALLNDGSDNWSGMNNAYPWMNYEYFAIDKDLTVKTGIKDSTTTGIEAEDSTYIKHTGAYEVQIYPGASSAQAVIGQNISTDAVDTDAIYYDWNKFAGVEFAVKAQSAGSQVITLGMIATHAAESTTAAAPKLMVYANGVWKEATLTKWNTFEEVAITVNLKEGTNVIKCVPVAAEEVAGTRVIFDYIEYDTSALTAVEVADFATDANIYNAGDEDKFLTNYYTDKGDTLGDASRNPLKEAKHYIDALTINKLSVVPYAAIKVNAETDGFYDINMVAGANIGAKSSQIALLVDGKAFALSFPLKSETTLSATIYLTQGTHMLIFTSPMPVDSETAAAAGEYDNSAYPWFNMNSFTFSKGLTFAEKPSLAEIDFAEVLGAVDGVINAGDETIVLPNHYTDGGDTLGSADANELKNNRVSVETLLLKGFDKAPFTSFNVTASEDGIYDIYALVQTDAKLTSGQIVVLVDRTQIVTVPVEAVGGNQMLHAQLPLTEGTHNLIFTSPMPATDEEAQAIPDGDSDGWAGMNGAYRWMNYIRFAIDKDLTVETGILDSKTEGIESENSVHMDYTGGYQEIVFPGASTGKVLGGDDVINLVSKLPEDADYYDWGQLSYIEMAVDADKAGKYEFTFNVIATQIAQATVFARTRAVDNTLPKVVVYANGKLYEKTISSWDEFEKITVEVDLVKGANVVRVFTVADEIKEGDRVFFDYVEYNRTALADVTVEEVKESQTIVKAGDETKVLFGHYTDKGDTLASASLGDLQWDKLSLDVLTYDHLNRIPYAAIKVTAEENGYYDVVLTLSAYNADLKSTQIGLLVDAKQKYVLSFEKTKYPEIHASIYLTKGTHTLVFTTPMPADKETAAAAEKFDKLAYPWVDMSTITLSEGLKVVGRPTVDEIETPFYNRVEAENGEYVLYNNYEPTPEASKNASNGYVIGGQMRWIFEQTFEELTAWLDAKHNSYIEYAIMAPADGEYNIRLGFLAGAKDESVAKPYIAVIVNGTTHKVQYTENWGNIQKEELTITLKEGLNIIRCTSYTIEQEGYEGKAWINHDFLDIDKRLMAVKRSSVKVEAEDSAYFNKFTVQDGEDYEKASGKVLGKADRKYISALKMTLDQISPENIKQIPYASFTVEAPANGYYAMSLDMATDGRLKRGTIGVLVDGQMNVVKYARTGKSTADGRADMLIYLTKGEHVLIFTTPMPADSSVEFNYSYNMANFDSLTLYDGLKLAKTQKAPTTEADYIRLEAEEHVMFNLNSNNGNAAGNAYYKVSQSVAEMFRDGIDGTRTPYVEFTIRASEAGTYTLYTGVSYGMTQGCTKDEIEAAFVVDTNGKLQTKTVQVAKNSTWSIVPVTVNLEKGTNKVRMTHLGSDSQCGGTTWIDFDYIEMSESTAAKLNFAKTGITLEAEEGVFVGYNTESGEGYHNGQYIGSADYGYVDENDVTFENLKPDDLDEMPHVTYNFEVEKAGTYTLSIGFASGLYHHLTAEMAEGRTGGFAVIVNGTSKQLVEFELTTANSHLSRNITVDLVEGENEITVTTTLADYIIAHTPRDDEKYRLIWIDHDYMVLSEGLSRGKEPEKYGLEDSDYNHAQITLKTDAGDKDDNVGDDATNKPSGLLGMVGDTIKDVIQNISENIPAPVLAGIGVAIAAAVGAIIVFIRKKFKKTKNIEESSK